MKDKALTLIESMLPLIQRHIAQISKETELTTTHAGVLQNYIKTLVILTKDDTVMSDDLAFDSDEDLIKKANEILQGETK